MKIQTLAHNGGGLRPTFLETIMGEGGYFHPFPWHGQLFHLLESYSPLYQESLGCCLNYSVNSKVVIQQDAPGRAKTSASCLRW